MKSIALYVKRKGWYQNWHWFVYLFKGQRISIHREIDECDSNKKGEIYHAHKACFRWRFLDCRCDAREPCVVLLSHIISTSVRSTAKPMHEFSCLKAHSFILQRSTVMVLSLISRYCLFVLSFLNSRYLYYILRVMQADIGTRSFLCASLCACLLSSAVVYTLPRTRGDFFSIWFFIVPLPVCYCAYTRLHHHHPSVSPNQSVDKKQARHEVCTWSPPTFQVHPHVLVYNAMH